MNIAKIRPLFEKGDKVDIRNYRPISVLLIVSKILEKIIYHSLLSFLKKFNILADEQNDFRDNKSTETACHAFTENIQQALDKNLHVVGIFLVLSKAYNVINNDIFLYKLESYEDRGILNLWFKYYLSQHTLSVSLTQTDCTKFTFNRYLSSSRVTL